MVMELRGVACLDLERSTPDSKSIMASRSFGRPVSSLPEMEEAVAAYVARAAEKLRRQNLATAHLVTFIETNRFKPGERQHYAARPVRLAVATSDTAKLIHAALAGLHAGWRDGYRYKKAGVVLLDLHSAGAVQEGLFDRPDDARRVALMRTLDRLQSALWPGYRDLCRLRPPSAVEDAARPALALLHDRLGPVAPCVGEGQGRGAKTAPDPTSAPMVLSG
jgi:DNA polymerase V